MLKEVIGKEQVYLLSAKPLSVLTIKNRLLAFFETTAFFSSLLCVRVR